MILGNYGMCRDSSYLVMHDEMISFTVLLIFLLIYK